MQKMNPMDVVERKIPMTKSTTVRIVRGTIRTWKLFTCLQSSCSLKEEKDSCSEVMGRWLGDLVL
jgi:hypothetical protein